MSKGILSGSHPQYADNVRELIGELGCLKAALTGLGEWRLVENVEETIHMTLRASETDREAVLPPLR